VIVSAVPLATARPEIELRYQITAAITTAGSQARRSRTDAG
jgi:hypothetical protein